MANIVKNLVTPVTPVHAVKSNGKIIIEITATGNAPGFAALCKDIYNLSSFNSTVLCLSAENMLKAISTLTPREGYAIVLRYGLADGNKHTYKEIAEVLDTTTKRAEELIKAALSKLRHPLRQRQFKPFALDELKQYGNEDELPCIEALISELSVTTVHGMKKFDMSRFEIIKALLERKECVPINENTPIEKLNLFVRAYNCLKRAGINTLGQIPTTREELLKIRNLGSKCTDEILEMLQNPAEYIRASREMQGTVTVTDIVNRYKYEQLCDDDWF